MARILFIEDEELEMRGVYNSLRRHHEVTLRTTAAEGLRELRQNPSNYDLVILDLMLPRGESRDPADEIPPMSREEVGEFVFKRMGEICPNMPTIILTAVRSNMVHLREAPRAELLQKPVKMAELLYRIAEMLKE